LFQQVVKDIGLDATDEKIKEYVWNLLKSGQVNYLQGALWQQVDCLFQGTLKGEVSLYS